MSIYSEKEARRAILNAQIVEMESILREIQKLRNNTPFNHPAFDALCWAHDQAWNELNALYAQRAAASEDNHG